MRLTGRTESTRQPAVAGTFYPSDPASLDRLVDACLATADDIDRRSEADASMCVGPLSGVLVPHAGLVYSGAVAAVAWRCLALEPPATIVLLGTNHGAGWLRGVGAWDSGAWETPLGAVGVDERLAAAIVALGEPFTADRAAHLREHSLEVQLPFVRRLVPGALVVPLAVSAGTGDAAVEAGRRLGELLAAERDAGQRVVLGISTDAAHYPPADLGEAINDRLTPAIESVDPAALAVVEAAVVDEGGPGLICGMCGIEPSVLGLAALRTMAATHGRPPRGRVVAAATSADVAGDRDRTVGYLAATFS